MIVVLRRVIASCFAVTLMLVAGLAAPAAAHQPYCGIHWGSQGKFVEPHESSATLTNVRVGRHACYDRLVVDMVGAASGYWGHIQETDDGRIYLSIVAAGTVPTENYERFEPSVAGFRTFRDVRLGSTGTEDVGSSQIDVRLRARLPFRVFTLSGAGGGSAPGTEARLVVDVAHRW
ncbi:AMIN-like domain-containing (lipo)protein [Cellulomonas cellasea]|uniref:AMIN-like domain-containing protein n=2 Tax=Cellulomonas cellasea TaxID=43670 RepID=A0A0A0B2N1_9CELL|nr:hypothetical protein [Cellulomonas cellasea]KGM01070.1 hypothetical protein Q760_04185 [Cellulomonas cellasea DSM 20118]